MKTSLFVATLLSAIGTVLADRDIVELVDGQERVGSLNGRSGPFVSLIVMEGRSSAELRIHPDEIRLIRFSDTADRQVAIEQYATSDPYQSTSILERLVRAREPYIGLLSESEEILFAMLVESYIGSGRIADALDWAKLWRVKLKSAEAIRRIEELQILGAWSLGDAEEAAFYSRRWLDRANSAKETALPWATLAEVAIEEGNVEHALWLALNPIVFSFPDNPRFLDRAYETAIFAATQLDRQRFAAQLYSDMKDRNLSWPIDMKRSAFLSQFNSNSGLESMDPEQETRQLNRSLNESPRLRHVEGAP